MDFIINDNSEFKHYLDKVKQQNRLGIHSFHRYYGKLIPAIPRASILKFTEENDLVFDPFCGSGTTGVESVYNKRNFLGVELNQLSRDISKVKTTKYNITELENYLNVILELVKNINIEKEAPPFCVNREHWFKPHVQEQMMKISKAINIVEFSNEDYKSFFTISLSAIVKNVSNADERHVFPGVSKRVRALEADKPVIKNVYEVYEKAVRKRISYFRSYDHELLNRAIMLGDSSEVNLETYYGKVDLVVTNPPYISSVRYVETLKLELYWMEYIVNQNEYKELSKKSIGNDIYNKGEYEEVIYTNYSEINDVITYFASRDLKSARIISDYFNKMEKVIEKCSKVLKAGGRMVVKISDSNIKKFKVETGKLLSVIALAYDFELEDLFLDKIQQNSRSLTTARNTYSDIILHDYIIVWRKTFEDDSNN